MDVLSFRRFGVHYLFVSDDYLMDPLFKRSSAAIQKLAKTARKELRQTAREKWARKNITPKPNVPRPN
jgi:hypothetical protein